MLPPSSLTGTLVEAIETAVGSVIEELSAGRVEQEPDFTSQLVGEIRGALRNAGIGGIQWEIKVLTDRGPRAQEKQYGADLLVVQHIDLPGYEVSKGFLAQAKLKGKKERRAALCAQARRMLEVTPESFLLLYGKLGIQVGSASAISASEANLSELRLKPFHEFLTDFMTSWVGDQRLGVADVAQLQSAQREWGVRAAVGAFVTPVDV